MLTSVRIPDEMEQKLTMLVELTGKKKSSFIIEALKEYLEDLEDYYIAAERLRNLDETENVSLAEMMKRYEMDN
jgi:RHH-type rel operon transcriptional repressor/antitoxin RelB